MKGVDIWSCLYWASVLSLGFSESYQSLVAVGCPVGSACVCHCMAEWDRCGQGEKAEWGFIAKGILFTPRIGVSIELEVSGKRGS